MPPLPLDPIAEGNEPLTSTTNSLSNLKDNNESKDNKEDPNDDWEILEEHKGLGINDWVELPGNENNKDDNDDWAIVDPSKLAKEKKNNGNSDSGGLKAHWIVVDNQPNSKPTRVYMVGLCSATDSPNSRLDNRQQIFQSNGIWWISTTYSRENKSKFFSASAKSVYQIIIQLYNGSKPIGKPKEIVSATPLTFTELLNALYNKKILFKDQASEKSTCFLYQIKGLIKDYKTQFPTKEVSIFSPPTSSKMSKDNNNPNTQPFFS